MRVLLFFILFVTLTSCSAKRDLENNEDLLMKKYAHEIAGRAVKLAIDTGCDLADLSLKQFKALCEHIDKDVYAVLTLEGAVAARDHFGATAPSQVTAAIQRARARLGA